MQKGFTLVEALIASALALTIVLGLIVTFMLVLRSTLANTPRTQAALLAEEGIEVTRLLRDASWSSNIATKTNDVPFYLTFNGTSWLATTTNTYINSTFERSVTLAAVYRDGNQNIVQSGGTLDPNARKVTVTVSWRQSATTSKSVSTYLTNVFSN